MTMVRSKLF